MMKGATLPVALFFVEAKSVFVRCNSVKLYMRDARGFPTVLLLQYDVGLQVY